MSPKTENIFAVCHFDSTARAQQAVGELKQAGIPDSAVSIIDGNSIQTKDASQIRQQFLTAGVQQDDAAHLEQELRSKGGVLAVVRTDSNNEDRVDQILSRYDGTGANAGASGQASGQQRTAAPGDTLKVVEEELVVGKRAVSRGGMRIYSRIIEKPVQEDVSLTEETVRVERTKVDRPISAAEVDALARDQVFEVNATGEEAVIGKRARVVEEVSIAKEASQRTETVRDTVRKTDVQVEKLSAENNAFFENDYKTRYGSTGKSFDTYAPAYQYGSEMANDPQYRGKSYSDVEQHLRSSYESRNPGSTWESVKDAVKTGWHKVTGKL